MKPILVYIAVAMFIIPYFLVMRSIEIIHKIKK
jgi:hypothetical protein